MRQIILAAALCLSCFSFTACGDGKTPVSEVAYVNNFPKEATMTFTTKDGKKVDGFALEFLGTWWQGDISSFPEQNEWGCAKVYDDHERACEDRRDCNHPEITPYEKCSWQR